MPVKNWIRWKPIHQKKCKDISKNEKNTGQNSKEYLKLKEDKKIEVMSNVCLEDSLDNQMPTSHRLHENEPVVVF